MEYMEMPTPCLRCGDTFDLNDGYGSQKWHPNVIICSDCYYEEKAEVDRDEEIENIILDMNNELIRKREGKRRLKELDYNPSVDFCL